MFLFSGVMTWLFEIAEKRILALPEMQDEDVAAPSYSEVVPANIVEWESSTFERKQPRSCVFLLNIALKYLEERATLSVRKAWMFGSDTDLLNIDLLKSSSSFCDVIYIPELEMHTKALSDRAIERLNVDLTNLSPLNMDKFREFVYCLKQQRTRLNKSRCEWFDSCWGIGPDQRFARQTMYPDQGVDVLIKQEIDIASQRCAAMRQEFESLSSMSKPPDKRTFDAIVGTRLLQYFVLDLLGRKRTASVVYRAKLGEGYVIIADVSVFFFKKIFSHHV